jgi:hypothetical protein
MWQAPLMSTTKDRTPHPSLLYRFRTRLRVEELESRTVLSVYTPLQISHAYGADQITFQNGTVKGDGSGQTIAIVDAYYDPSIQADLAAFSQRFGLAPLDGKNGDGTFTQVDLSGKKALSPPGDDWTVETALDVEWAHAIAPKASVVLVEAASDRQDPATGEPTDLLNAVQYAATKMGASTVSMSWGINEVPGEKNWDSFFTTPGVTFVAASGDSGAGTIWPAVSPNVVSVGGTTLRLTSSNTIAGETGWGNGRWSFFLGGSGGGLSQYEPLPAYQQSAGISSTYTQFNARLNPDVAYNADPSTGYYVLDSAAGGWFAVGGTSAGAPQWAALIAIADQGRASANLAPLSSAQTLNALYSNPQNFHDITQGNTGAYFVVNASGRITGQIPVTAGPRYDLVTGLGTPVANVLVPALAQAGTSGTAQAGARSGSGSGSSSNQGSGSASRPQDLPQNPGDPPGAPASPPNPTGDTTSGLPANQVGLVLASLAAAQARSVPVTPAGTGSVPAARVTVVPAGAVLTPNLAANPRTDSGVGGLIDQDNGLADNQPASDGRPADQQPTGPTTPAVAPAAPPPLVPDAGDAGFIPDERVPGPGEEEGPDGAAANLKSAGVLGLAVAAAWGWQGPALQAEAPERRRGWTMRRGGARGRAGRP